MNPLLFFSYKAFMFQQTLKNGAFIVSMLVITEVFSLAPAQAVCLQTKNSDLASAMNTADSLNFLFIEMRENAGKNFMKYTTRH